MRTWQTIRDMQLGWHSHDSAYAAVVLSGCYEEAGDCGRYRVTTGQVVFHDQFEGHLDRLFSNEVQVLNLPLPVNFARASSLAAVTDPDAIVRVAEKDKHEAALMLLETCTVLEQAVYDWPDALALELLRDPSLRITAWASKRGMAPWDVTRGFQRVFAITPEGFRARSRAHLAWRRVRHTTDSLAEIAAEFGFSDQSHMTRCVKQLTGRSPSGWRPAANRFKT